MTFKNFNTLTVLLLTIGSGISYGAGEVVINEISATGSEGYLDNDGDSSDWIEVYNSGDAPISLGGYFLTDDSGDLTKWTLPNVDLAVDSHLVIYASGKDRATPGSEFHTNFSLSRNGEFLALVEPDGTSVADSFDPSYPVQSPDYSYGRSGANETTGFMEPSPGSANGAVLFAGLVEDTQFSMDRGFYENPFALEITSDTESASIRYTTDGSKPTETNGTLYTGPITISGTTAIRALAYKTDFKSSNVDTQTYLFLDQVLQQPEFPSGYPTNWNSIEGNQTSDYAMDPQVVGPIYSESEIKNGLSSLPVVCISTEIDNLFGANNGIYINARQRGDAWEREVSVEFFNFAHGRDLQVNAGLRMNGNYSRNKGQHKHNMRLVFREDYGLSRLQYELFENTEVQRFNSLIVRGFSGDSWAHPRYPHAQYIRDQWFRDMHEAMGYEGMQQREVHVYFNGLYWGMHHIFERAEDDSAAEHFGGEEEDWEVIKDGNNSSVVSIDGGTEKWDALMGIVNSGSLADSARYAAVQDHLDLEGFIDYMLLNFYGGNDDWGNKNYRAAINKNSPDGRWLFFPHDSERAGYNALGGAGINKNNLGINDTYRFPQVHHDLTDNAEYRLRFADRAHHYLFNGGALTENVAGGLWMAVADRIREGMKAECARWGDNAQDLRGASGIQTLDEWQALVDREMDIWYPQRSAILVSQLQAQSLYPDIAAPVFSQHGGNISPATEVTMFTDADTIYYTLDGSDPRLVGGGVSPSALSASFGGGGPSPTTYVDTGHIWRFWDQGTDPGANWKEESFDDTSWSSGPSSLGYGNDGEGSGTTVSFGPNSSEKYAATYFRTTVTIPDPTAYENFLLRVKYDDALGLYINGTPILLTPNLPNGANSAYDEYASAPVSDEGTWKDYTFPTNFLQAGENTIAVQVHQRSGTSSDLRLDVILRGEVTPTGGGGNQSDPIAFTGSSYLTARSYNSSTNEWSALNQAHFAFDVVTADGGSLVVSEFNYRPHEPVLPGEIAISTDRDDYEYVELLNIGPSTLSLDGVRIEDGITFEFPPLTFLDPGKRILVVANLAAFTERYGGLIGSTPIAGEFTGSLNNAGERILITGLLGTIRDFVYSDQLPWPTSADGDGPSLVLVDPTSLPDHSDGLNWRASTSSGGAPGASDSLSFADWKAARGILDDEGDPDLDVLNNFGEFAAGTAFDTPNYSGAFDLYQVMNGPDTHIGIDTRLSLSAMDEVAMTIESASDLATWNDATSEFSLGGQTYHGDGTVTLSFQSILPISSADQNFFRIQFRQR